MLAVVDAAAVRRLWRNILVALAITAMPATDAGAVVKGMSSSLGQYTVRIVGKEHCSGVVISRHAVVTAGHCVSRRVRVMAGGAAFSVAGIARSATADDGRRVTVSGDAAILLMADALPSSVASAPVGAGDGNVYTIAGYGTLDEGQRTFGSLHEAQLVAAGRGVLQDPNRAGSIGASACFGDSGGPVIRGNALIGVITRASHPGSRLACGHLTRWAPIMVHGAAVERADRFTDDGRPVAKRRSISRGKSAKRRRVGRTGLGVCTGEPPAGRSITRPRPASPSSAWRVGRLTRTAKSAATD